MVANTSAIDTNLVVRYLIGEPPEQYERAWRLIEGADVFVPVTVVLETEWVLRSNYGLSRGALLSALRGFVGLRTVTVGEADAVLAALDLFEGGMDFADALHLALSSECEEFVTFDRDLVKAATAAGIAGVRDP
jgi:predicted nucleic-acid-binding protein